MMNETNGLSSAILSLVAAFEAERKAFGIAYKAMEERLCKLENEMNVLPASHNTLALRVSQLEANERADQIEDRIDALSTRLGWLDQRFEEQVSGSDMSVNAAQRIDARIEDLDNRVVFLETANRIRAEIAGTDDDRHDELAEKLDELERTVERIDGRVDDLENKDDDDAIREAVESMLDSARISINL